MRAVNLIPADQRSGGSLGAGRSGGAAYAILGTFAGVALMALLYGIAHHEYNSRQKEAVTLSAKAQAAQAQVGALTPYTSFVAMRKQRAAAVEELVNSRFDWAHNLHELARVLPTNASISSLSGAIGGTGGSASAPAPAPGSTSAGSTSGSGSSSGAGTTGSSGSSSTPASSAGASTTTGAGVTPAAGVAVTSATPAGSVPTFTIQGCAESQAVVAKTIDRLRLIDGVASVTLQSSTASSLATGGGAGSGQCPSHNPAYQLQVIFQALPSSAEITSTVKSATVADTKNGARR